MGTRREQRAVRRQQRQAPPLLMLPFRQPRHPLPPLAWLAPAQIGQLHEASLTILETIGVDFLDAETLAIWDRAGARVDHKGQHVWLDRGLVLEAIARARCAGGVRGALEPVARGTGAHQPDRPCGRLERWWSDGFVR